MARDWGGGRDAQVKARGSEGSQTTVRVPSWWIHAVMHVFKPTECPSTTTEPNGNERLWVITMCQRGFFGCNKRIALEQNVNRR